MEQLSLFKSGISLNKKDLSIFNDEIEIKKEYTNEPILKKNVPKHLVEHYYVRTRDKNTYRIDGLSRPQKVFIGYEIKKNYKGEKYRKEVFELRERGYTDIYINGKNVQKIIRHEDIILQSPFLIDLCFKNDYVVAKDNKIYFVEHKEFLKPIEVEEFYKDEYEGKTKKRRILHSRSFLLCKNKVLKEEDIAGLVYNPPFDYEKCLEKGVKVKSDYWGWSVILKVMNKKILCNNERSPRPFFIFYNQITDVIDCD